MFGEERIQIENSTSEYPHDTDYTRPYYEKLTLPAQFSFGMEYQIVPRFGISTEIQTRNLKYIELTDGSGQDFFSVNYISNGIFASFSLEAIAGIVPLRTGVFFEALPLKNIDISHPVHENENLYTIGATFGTGIKIKDAVNIDLGIVWNLLRQDQTLRNPLSTNPLVPYKDYTRVENNLRIDLGLSINIPCPHYNSHKQASSAEMSQPVVQPAAPVLHNLPPTPAKPFVGDMVIIKTYDGTEYLGQLMQENLDNYILNAGGVIKTFLKNSTSSITKQ
jgi:hypothetical protein